MSQVLSAEWGQRSCPHLLSAGPTLLLLLPPGPVQDAQGTGAGATQSRRLWSEQPRSNTSSTIPCRQRANSSSWLQGPATLPKPTSPASYNSPPLPLLPPHLPASLGSLEFSELCPWCPNFVPSHPETPRSVQLDEEVAEMVTGVFQR